MDSTEPQHPYFPSKSAREEFGASRAHNPPPKTPYADSRDAAKLLAGVVDENALLYERLTELQTRSTEDLEVVRTLRASLRRLDPIYGMTQFRLVLGKTDTEPLDARGIEPAELVAAVNTPATGRIPAPFHDVIYGNMTPPINPQPAPSTKDPSERDADWWRHHAESLAKNSVRLSKAAMDLFEARPEFIHDSKRELWAELGEALMGEQDERVRELRETMTPKPTVQVTHGLTEGGRVVLDINELSIARAHEVLVTESVMYDGALYIDDGVNSTYVSRNCLRILLPYLEHFVGCGSLPMPPRQTTEDV